MHAIIENPKITQFDLEILAKYNIKMLSLVLESNILIIKKVIYLLIPIIFRYFYLEIV